VLYYGHGGSRRLQGNEELAGHAGGYEWRSRIERPAWTRLHGGLTLLRLHREREREGIGYPDADAARGGVKQARGRSF
jgi:hypothetical protein